jgi:hypothetical protein
VQYDPPYELLGTFLNSWDNPIRLEGMIRTLSQDGDAYVADNACRADRAGDSIVVSHDAHVDEVLDLPFAAFESAAQDFLDWMRSQAPATSNRLELVLADWLAGGVEARKAILRIGGAFAREAFWEPLSDDGAKQRMDELVGRIGPVDAQETLEKLAQLVAQTVERLEVDPRYGAAVIARLAGRLEDDRTERGRLMAPFVPLDRDARAALGKRELVADVEHRIRTAADALAAGAGPLYL